MNRDRFDRENVKTNRFFIRRNEDAAGVRSCFGAVPLSSSPSLILLSFLFIFLFSSVGWSATPSGTVISNVATATYTPSTTGILVSSLSNTASVTTTILHTSASIEYLQYGPTAPGAQYLIVPSTSYSPSGNLSGPFLPLASPLPIGSTTPLNLSQPVPLVPVSQYHQGEPVFIRLTDLDQNNDPAVAETIVITIRDDKTNDSEVIRLIETGPNTGVFLGFIQTVSQQGTSNNGFLNVSENSSIRTNYTDVINNDTATLSALVDPFGIVFSSSTGQPVNGALVRLLDASTGLPAAVLGDDGISTFPTSLTTGGTAQDSSGRVYTFSPGGYRFPFVKPGRYRLSLTPPAGYRAPSTVPTAALQSLPGNPFAIVDPGSREEEFVVNPGPTIHIDIPLDPVSTRLYLIKTVDKPTAAVGDFIPYKLQVENTDMAVSVPGVIVTDRLPNGFRYRKGSAKLNLAPMPAPAISGDGRSLTFSIGDLAAGATAEIHYVAEVGAGTGIGTATNSAIANGTGGAVSNTALAVVQIIEDLFMSKTTIVGRVIDDCKGGGRGIAGVRIFLEDGTYVVTDKNGMYHFAAVNPGTHVVQLDTVTIPERYEPVICEDNSRFAGSAISQFVDLQGGSLWRADFHLKPRPPKEKLTGEVGLELKSALLTDPTATHTVNPDSQYGIVYAVPMQVGTVPLRNLRLVVMLPQGVTFQQGSSKLNDLPIPDPDIIENILTFRLGEKADDWEGTIQFHASLPIAGDAGEIVTKAFLIFDTPDAKGERTPPVDTILVRYTREEERTDSAVVLRPTFDTLKANLSAGGRKEVERAIQELKNTSVDHITVIGHTDSNKIKPGSNREFPDNYALSRARAQTVAAAIAAALELRPDQITIVGKGPDEPIASNKTAQGRALNRRVELRVEARHTSMQTRVTSEKAWSGMKTVATAGLPIGESWNAEPSAGKKTKRPEQAVGDGKTMPDYNAVWIETAEPGTSWLWPSEGHHPNIASTRIAIKHDPALKPKLFLNNTAVDPVFYEGFVKKSDNTVVVSLWRGIHLIEGDNTFELVLLDGAGVEAGRMQRTMHYSGPPAKAVLLPERSRLVADGKNPILLAYRLLDKDGHPAREGVRGDYFVDPPYLPQKRVDDLQKSPLILSDNDRLRYVIGEDGVTLIELAPTTRTGEAVLRFQIAEGLQEIRTWLKPEDRDWILVGLAEGTVGYNVVRGNMETLAASAEDERLYEKDRLAFYAKGRIKGEWLLTLAYDSKKASSNDPQSMYQTIDPNKYYTLYGDGTEQRYDAASAKHIYIKLERDQFYALFGDYSTGLSTTELSRYNRNLTGFKSELKTDHFEYNLFVADTNQAYVRDEIQGDGTSGLYHLSRKNIVLNSETLTIETRDRFRSELIVSTQRLMRYLDYTIDYDSGTIFFKSPVFSRDGNFNPVFIIAEYESFDPSDTAYNYGGRGAVRLFDNRVEVGATHVHEGSVGGSGNLEGADAKIKLSDADTLRAEVATTKTDQSGTTQKGSAYLAELQHRTETMEGRAYVREQDPGFGLGQQNGSETGMRKFGADLNYRLSKPWTIGGELYQQNNLSTGAVRDVGELRGRYATGQFDMLAGVRYAKDSFGTGDDFRSDQIFAGMKYQLTERTSVRIRHDQSLGSNDNVDYPTRTTIGADYKLSDTSTLYADQEWTHGATIDTETTRIGVKASLWTGGQIGSTMEQQTTEYGVRLFSTTGLKQTWQVTKEWSVDGGLDRSTTLRNTGTYTFNPNTPPASGSTEDFTAMTFGVGYNQKKWSWTARVESRIADSENRTGVFTGANGEVRDGLGLATAVQAFRTASVTGQEKFNGDVRLGLAYRPIESRVIILERLDFIKAEQHGGDALRDDSWRIVNNLVTNVMVNSRTQVSLQYAAKYVRETIDENDYHGYTDLMGIEGRYDFTKKWDVGLRGLMLHSWNLDQSKYGTGVSVGYNAGKNIWVSVGYNVMGFKDRDFSQADFTSQGPFIKLRMKFDQTTARDAVKWFSGQ